ncbi:MAG: hypothetical protein AAGJ35_12400, partial [Myxococcota bacterium]
EIYRTSRDGGVVLVRSVEPHTLIEIHNQERRFQLLKEASDVASAEDRSRQYERVHFYRIVH